MGKDLVPSDDRINREGLERVIHRAAELQTRARDIGDQLTEQDVLELGQEVGIPTRYLQQALLEERAREVTAENQGLLVKLAGPKRLSAERTVPGKSANVAQALSDWMIEHETLIVKRRYPHGTSWEARKDWLAAVKRGFGVGGRRYALARTKEILGRVEELEAGWSHVTLIADLSNTRTERLAGGTLFFASGATLTTIGVVLGVATGVAVIPVVAAAVGGVAIARTNRAQIERVHVAMEQVLDHLERGEIGVSKPTPKQQPEDFVRKLTAEIKEIGRNWGK